MKLKKITAFFVSAFIAASMVISVDSLDNVKGDINGDSIITVTDAALTAAHVKGIKSMKSTSLASADVNSDGKVNITDAVLIAAHVKGLKPLTANDKPKDEPDKEVHKPDVTVTTQPTVTDEPHFTFTTSSPTQTLAPVITETPTTTTKITTAATTKQTTTRLTTTTTASTTYEPVFQGDIRSFVLNTKTHKVHTTSCNELKKLKDENRRDFVGTAAELQYEGYSACKKCNPF